MAKTKHEKLIEAITAALLLREEAVVGEDEGQYTQGVIDELSIAIELAKEVADMPDSEPTVYEDGTTVLLKSINVFKAAQIKSQNKDQPPQPESQKLTLKGVVLKGWPEGQKGIHTLHLKERIITFIDGEAELPEQMVENLQKAGYLE
ncbi:hypothetical protein P4H66_19470 [Paenibacillus dokdonensis]|uniref:Phage protein n=1 Tax=Paenibacillus dokdonensis TaxID=2567944 RepID=A0ABU6GQJ2_9BACL|nr:hypothetical protein [Paenibacillus dokdonensis]MEC0241986.1 hypothetical protein [Paenibacillus dokdonensis]